MLKKFNNFKYMKRLFLVLFISSFYLNGQCQQKNMAKKLTKKETAQIVNSENSFFDDQLSDSFNLKIYRVADTKLLILRDDNTGILWNSVDEIYSILKNSEIETKILNLDNWIENYSQLESAKLISLEKLKKWIANEDNFSLNSLSKLDAISIRSIKQEKDLLYALIIYCCEVCAKEINGTIGLENISTKFYRPIVVDKFSNIYIPYHEFLRAITENNQISISESLKIELQKFKLSR